MTYGEEGCQRARQNRNKVLVQSTTRFASVMAWTIISRVLVIRDSPLLFLLLFLLLLLLLLPVTSV